MIFGPDSLDVYWPRRVSTGADAGAQWQNDQRECIFVFFFFFFLLIFLFSLSLSLSLCCRRFRLMGSPLPGVKRPKSKKKPKNDQKFEKKPEMVFFFSLSL